MAGIKVKTMNIDDYKGMAKPMRKDGHRYRTTDNDTGWSTCIAIAFGASVVSIDKLDSAIMALPEILELCRGQKVEIERLHGNLDDLCGGEISKRDQRIEELEEDHNAMSNWDW